MTEKLTVLYVDDEPDLRELAELSLQLDEHIVVQSAESGAMALDLIDTGACRPDVIMLDVMMPDMDGPAVLSALRLRAAHKTTPVIFITARTQQQEASAYRAMDIVGFITKPFDPTILASEVRRFLRPA
jgi:two-component system OmpR family response regulator